MNFSTSARRSITNWRCGRQKLRCVLSVPHPHAPVGKTDCASRAASRLPDWACDGVTRQGIQAGTEVCQQKLDTMRNAGVKVNGGIWAGLVRYPHDLLWQTRDVELEVNSDKLSTASDSRIKQWKEEGVQFSLSLYINPYVASDKDLPALRRRNTAIWRK
ncbi:hypothetical protein KCP73_11465 [Salmonella enterica subsp. enterica]|nr:hypothetical protein KCP73_11465 [Salmonella enterica subsp. enterica]